MTDPVSQEIETARVSLSQDDVCGIMAEVDTIRRLGWSLDRKPGGELIGIAQRIEGIIYNGTYEPGRKNERP